MGEGREARTEASLASREETKGGAFRGGANMTEENRFKDATKERSKRDWATIINSRRGKAFFRDRCDKGSVPGGGSSSIEGTIAKEGRKQKKKGGWGNIRGGARASKRANKSRREAVRARSFMGGVATNGVPDVKRGEKVGK